jgi:FKBP-type peptidyl-prolyl cis-trans isomerase FkpA
VAPASEIAAVQAYLTSQGNSTALQHASGLFYEITAPGSSAKPGLCNSIQIKYVGKLTNGNIFDSNLAGISFVLGNLIIGWQKGIPLVGKSGAIRLYVPPSLGYGNTATGSIPANSILVFDIQMLDFF